MVELLYALIILPIIFWLISFGYETWIILGRSGTGDYTLGAKHIDATWEISHTFLVYAFTIFLMSHADALALIDRTLFIPVCLFMMSLMVRGCLYLYLGYGENIRFERQLYNLFALSYLVTIVSILAGAIGVVYNLYTFNFTPSTDNIVIVAIGFVLTTAFVSAPVFSAFRRNS